MTTKQQHSLLQQMTSPLVGEILARTVATHYKKLFESSQEFEPANLVVEVLNSGH